MRLEKNGISKMQFSSVEICAGAGGQALGLELAGFNHEAAIEIDKHACETLRVNRPEWLVIESDLKQVSAKDFKGIDLFAGGVPCPPFSIAGKQLGSDDERDLFPDALRMVSECKPPAVMLENVRGLSGAKFSEYRNQIICKLNDMGYEVGWKLLNSCDYGVPQLRPRFILVGLKKKYARSFQWPAPNKKHITVADSIGDLMSVNGWKGSEEWLKRAASIAPTIVGGSKKHGGADLGPGRARQKWDELGVDGRGITEFAPSPEMPLTFKPRLTLRMVARIQGFPDEWQFSGKKTAAYRQIGNAFPPPVARAVGQAIARALAGSSKTKVDQKFYESELFPLV